jgi:hypothetical protein
MKKNLLNLFAFCTTFSYLIAEENIQNHTDETTQTEQTSSNSTNDDNKAEIKGSCYNWNDIALYAIGTAIALYTIYKTYYVFTRYEITSSSFDSADNLPKERILELLKEASANGDIVSVELNGQTLSKEDAIEQIAEMKDRPSDKTMTTFEYTRDSEANITKDATKRSTFFVI